MFHNYAVKFFNDYVAPVREWAADPANFTNVLGVVAVAFVVLLWVVSFLVRWRIASVRRRRFLEDVAEIRKGVDEFAAALEPHPCEGASARDFPSAPYGLTHDVPFDPQHNYYLRTLDLIRVNHKQTLDAVERMHRRSLRFANKALEHAADLSFDVIDATLNYDDDEYGDGEPAEGIPTVDGCPIDQCDTDGCPQCYVSPEELVEALRKKAAGQGS